MTLSEFFLPAKDIFFYLIDIVYGLPWLHVTRVLALLLWVYVFCQSFPGLKALLFAKRSEITKQDRDDAWVAAVAAMVIGFNVRWYVNTDSESLFTSLYVFCTLVAFARILTHKTDRIVSEGDG